MIHRMRELPKAALIRLETDDHPQRTIALSALAIAAVIVVFATLGGELLYLIVTNFSFSNNTTVVRARRFSCRHKTGILYRWT
jgi:hypothetical protein